MKYVVLLLILTLAACNTTKEVETIKLQLIEPPTALYNCPQIASIPNPETLTNQEVADFIKLLYKYNKICGISLKAIKDFVAESKIALKE